MEFPIGKLSLYYQSFTNISCQYQGLAKSAFHYQNFALLSIHYHSVKKKLMFNGNLVKSRFYPQEFGSKMIIYLSN